MVVVVSGGGDGDGGDRDGGGGDGDDGDVVIGNGCGDAGGVVVDGIGVGNGGYGEWRGYRVAAIFWRD